MAGTAAKGPIIMLAPCCSTSFLAFVNRHGRITTTVLIDQFHLSARDLPPEFMQGKVQSPYIARRFMAIRPGIWSVMYPMTIAILAWPIPEVKKKNQQEDTKNDHAL